jgi:hypothetical protein
MAASVTPINNTQELPPVLRLLAHAVDFVQASDLAAALPIARAMLASVPPHVSDDDGYRLNVQCEKFIDDQARKDYPDVYEQLREIRDGGVFNMYVEPSVALGVALAFVLLTDRGGVR